MQKIYFDDLKNKNVVWHGFCDVLVREIPPKILIEIYCESCPKKTFLEKVSHLETPNVETILNRFQYYMKQKDRHI